MLTWCIFKAFKITVLKFCGDSLRQGWNVGSWRKAKSRFSSLKLIANIGLHPTLLVNEELDLFNDDKLWNSFWERRLFDFNKKYLRLRLRSFYKYYSSLAKSVSKLIWSGLPVSSILCQSFLPFTYFLQPISFIICHTFQSL